MFTYVFMRKSAFLSLGVLEVRHDARLHKSSGPSEAAAFGSTTVFGPLDLSGVSVRRAASVATGLQT